MKKVKQYLPWIAALLVFVAILLTVYFVESRDSGKSISRFPEDAIEASLKMGNAGYAVTTESNPLMLGTIANDACQTYGIAFSSTLSAYLSVTDKESGEPKAEIFYFDIEADAKVLYEAIKSQWTFEKEQGELRYKNNVVYMGVSEALNALEK